MSIVAQSERDGGPEQETSAITISVNGKSVHVTGANGADLEIYNLTGSKVGRYHIDSNDKTFSLNLPKGCYILKVGGVVRKTSIQ